MEELGTGKDDDNERPVSDVEGALDLHVAGWVSVGSSGTPDPR